MEANAYIENNCVCIVGVFQSNMGPIPFACKTLIEGEDQFADGPINLAGEIPPPIEAALSANHDKALFQVQKGTMEVSARDIVLRARAGDQVAMADIIKGKELAARGSKQAKFGLRLIAEYIKKHPINKPTFSGDKKPSTVLGTIQRASSGTNLHYATVIVALVPNAGDKSLNDIAVTVANGPALTNQRLKEVTHVITSGECRKAFAYGLKNDSGKIKALAKSMNPECLCAMQTGYALGVARRIQAVRDSNVPISVLSKRVAWELGE